MGNSNSRVDRNQNQSLLYNSQVNDVDISLAINDQPQVKQIYAIKNPVFLKRNTLSIERDSDKRNLYYIQFVYDAMVDLNINFYFNASRNNMNEQSEKNEKTKLKNNHITNSNTTISANLNYLPSTNFKENILKFNNCLKGQNVKFFNSSAVIDMNYFITNKEEKEESIDLVIEFEPIFETKINEIFFYTLCKIYTDADLNSNFNVDLISSSIFKIKTESQRLKSQSMWFDLYEVFNSALETGECLICCSNHRNTIFLPCKHSCTCQPCAHSLRMRNNPCPICKNSIDDLVIIENEEST